VNLDFLCLGNREYFKRKEESRNKIFTFMAAILNQSMIHDALQVYFINHVLIPNIIFIHNCVASLGVLILIWPLFHNQF